MRALTLVALLAVTRGAAADRPAAEQLAAAAKADRDPDKYVACGRAYLDVYNADPKAATADEDVYNAAVCFADGKSAGAAISALRALRSQFPRSKLQARALARLAALYERAAMLDEAAVHAEEYARKFPAEADAADLLVHAIALRAATGNDAAQLAGVQLFVKTYGTKRPADAAQLVFAAGDIVERARPRDAAIAHYRDHVRTYGGKAGPELEVRALAKLGELQLLQSCTATTDGLCLKYVRARTLPISQPPGKVAAAPLRCGAVAHTPITAIARSPARVKEATQSLEAAVTAYSKLKTPELATQAAIARARLALADLVFEEQLAVVFPTDLDFSPDKKAVKDASLKRFDGYIKRKQTLGTKARADYDAVIAQKHPATAIAAMARVGLMQQLWSHELATAPIPKDVRTGEFVTEKVAAFCDKLVEVSEPLVAAAISAYESCLGKAAAYGVIDASSRACEWELGRLAPTKFALTSELVPSPAIAVAMTREPVIATTRTTPKPLAAAIQKYVQTAGAVPLPRPACESLARTFAELAKQHRSADAHYMAGLTYGHCGMAVESKAAYDLALQAKPGHAAAMSNLGELHWRAGRHAEAKQQWQAALAADGKLFAASANLAAAALREFHALAPADPKRAPLAQEIRLRAGSAAIADEASPLPHAQLALLALATPNQLALARHHATRAASLDDRPADVALVIAAIHAAAIHARDDHPMALTVLERAVKTTPHSDAASLALGLHYVKLRRHDAASATLATVKTPSYELAIGRGIVARAAGKPADAEARYGEAIALAAARPEAHFNLGVLWKDHVAARATDKTAAKAALRKAADAFRRANTAEAKLLADDCDKPLALL